MARKHLGWYMDTAQTPKELRRKVLTSKSCDEVLTMIPDAIAEVAA
jgi:tRNA-dihydrouridine synthase B